MYQTNHKHQSCFKGLCLHKWAAHLHSYHQTTSLFPGWSILYRWLNWSVLTSAHPESSGTPAPHSADKTEHPHQKTHGGSSLHPIQPLEDPRDSSRTPVLFPSCWGQQDLKNWLDKAIYSVGLLNRRFSLKCYQTQENQGLCTTEVVYQMTGCTVPAKSRKVTFNTFLKKNPTYKAKH